MQFMNNWLYVLSMHTKKFGKLCWVTVAIDGQKSSYFFSLHFFTTLMNITTASAKNISAPNNNSTY